MRDNLKQIRDAQEENKMKLEEEQRPRDDPFKLKQYKNVQSKLGSTQYNNKNPGYVPEKGAKKMEKAQRTTGGGFKPKPAPQKSTL